MFQMGAPITQREGAIFWEELLAHCKVMGYYAANRSRCHLGEDLGGPKQPCVRSAFEVPLQEGALLRDVSPTEVNSIVGCLRMPERIHSWSISS